MSNGFWNWFNNSDTKVMILILGMWISVCIGITYCASIKPWW